MGITNPPYVRPLMHALIWHFARILPTWLLIESDWAYTKQAGPFMPGCSDIVRTPALDRGTTMSGKQNLLVSLRRSPRAGPIFHPYRSALGIGTR